MIVVIADDLTGAAELGGIGLRHGLRTVIVTAVGDVVEADLLVVAADTRSKGVDAAVTDMLAITRWVAGLRPEWVYKKTDSVLRGHVVAELKVHMAVLGFSRALLVPANPALGRTIKDGQYFLNGRPVHESAFSIDPEFPVRSSMITEMLGGEDLAALGIVVGEAERVADLEEWASRVEPGMLLAGAAGFFSAILDRGKRPVLYVSGTTFSERKEDIIRVAADGGPVLYMPAEPDEEWIAAAAALLRGGKLIVGIDAEGVSALELRTNMARAIGGLLRKVAVGELIIEGGSTAYAILEQAGLHHLVPVEQLAQGVIRMRASEAPGLYVTVKPGSYQWPESIRY